jgi:diadenosine tetraphosphate (Ap4A) HIT family hydrolase
MIIAMDLGPEDCALCRPVLLTPIVRESAHWRIAINRNQNLLGKLLVALRRHEESVAVLTAAEWSELRGELRWAIERLGGAFRPDHFNCSFLQNQDRHVHLHVIPRYASTRTFAGREFADPDWPNHYSLGVEYLAPPEVVAAIADALA